MLEQIRKRDGRIVPFSRDKIASAIRKAFQAVQGHDTPRVDELTDRVITEIEPTDPGILPTVEQIQDTIEQVLFDGGHARTAKAFILYRARRSRIREGKSDLMAAVDEILREIEPETGEVLSPVTKMLRIGAAASKEYYLKRLLPEEFADAHARGDMHIQCFEHYAKTVHSFEVPLARLLSEGLNTPWGSMPPPRSPHAATTFCVAALQACRGDTHGGLEVAQLDRDLASIAGDGPSTGLDEALAGLLGALSLSQGPSITFGIGADPTPAGRLIAGQILDALAATTVGPTIRFQLRTGVNLDAGDPNHDLLCRAIDLASQSKRLVFGTEQRDHPGPGAIAHVVLNLPRLALKARRDHQGFDLLLDRVMELALDQLRHRFEVLSRLKASELPVLMGQGLFPESAGLGTHDPIAEPLRRGRLSVGFAGLAEALVALSGRHHGEAEEAQQLGLRIVERLRQHTERASDVHGLRFCLSASDSEEAAARFAMLDCREFGSIEGITDHDAYAESFQVPALSDSERAESAEILFYSHISGPIDSPAAATAVRLLRGQGQLSLA